MIWCSVVCSDCPLKIPEGEIQFSEAQCVGFRDVPSSGNTDPAAAWIDPFEGHSPTAGPWVPSPGSVSEPEFCTGFIQQNPMCDTGWAKVPHPKGEVLDRCWVSAFDGYLCRRAKVATSVFFIVGPRSCWERLRNIIMRSKHGLQHGVSCPQFCVPKEQQWGASHSWWSGAETPGWWRQWQFRRWRSVLRLRKWGERTAVCKISLGLGWLRIRI